MRRNIFAMIWVVLTSAPAWSQEPTAEQTMFDKVMGRLLKNDLFVKDYPSQFVYPPKAFIKANSAKELNAYASASKLYGAEYDAKNKTIRPAVMITEGYLRDVVQGDENVLAIIMGHELGHLTKNHVSTFPKGDTGLLSLHFGRDDEIEADLEGMKYAVAAGYSYKNGIGKAFSAMRQNTKYTSFEGLSSTHPTWEERLTFLDKAQAKLWTAMCAFQNGSLFLELEQYASAQQCFKAVVAEFPDCHEGWANLGYARLMLYCDALDAEDLRRFGVGQFVSGGFYARPDSLEALVRGTDEKLWKDAVAALQRALTLKPDLVLPRSSLGIAYLVNPSGKEVQKARKMFTEALDLVAKDAELRTNPLCLASVTINAAVADLAANDTNGASAKLQSARAILDKSPYRRQMRGMNDALNYNRAMVLARSKEREDRFKARMELEYYMEDTSPDSAWWPTAYLQYTKLSKELDMKARPYANLLRRAGPKSMRLVTSIPVGQEVITLAEPIEGAVKRLGKDAGAAIPLYPDAKIVRWKFSQHGIDLLAKDKILAIFLTGKQAPPVSLRASGAATDAHELKVGMAEDTAKQLLKVQYADRNLRFIADVDVGFHFYPELGLAIRYADKRVAEIAIAQIPRQSFAGK